jgi:hypothetical protein
MTPDDLKFLASLAFGAGGAWFLIKQSRKDVNGLGAKVNKEVSVSARRHINTALSLMLLAPSDEIRSKLVDLLREDE